MSQPPDDDLRRMLREFRESTAAAFAAHDARFEALEGRMGGLEGRMGGLEGRMTGLEGSVRDLAEEFRVRTSTMERTILNSIRDFSRSVDHRLTRVEQRLDGAA
ncbi:MAG: hypothetical protein ACR2HR_01160 [Euzebya sp.]